MSAFTLQSFIFLNIILSSLIFGVHSANILGIFISGHDSNLLVYAAVVNRLLARGHNVTVVTAKHVKDYVIDEFENRPNLRHVRIPVNTTVISCHPGRFKPKLNEMLDRMETSAQFLGSDEWKGFVSDEKSRNQTYDLMLLGYFFNEFQLGIAAEFKCPVAIIWTAQPISFIHQLIGNPEERIYVTQAYDKKQRTGIRAILLAMYEKIIEFYVTLTTLKVYERYFKGSGYPNYFDMRGNVSLMLCNHHSISEGPIAPYVPAMIDIGGLQNDGKIKGTLPKLLQDSKKKDWIFLSLGTRFDWNALMNDLKATFLEAFQQFSNYTIIWSYDGEDCQENFFVDVENANHILCQKWWQQNLILSQPNTKLFITHGGKGSLSEALYYAVPILGLPMFSDQHVGIRKMISKGYGLSLDIKNLTKSDLISSINEILHNSTYGEAIAQGSKLYLDRPQTPSESTVYWLEYVIRHKGARHMQSPLVHLNFLQQYSIDIYFVIFLFVYYSVVILNYLERKLDAL